MGFALPLLLTSLLSRPPRLTRKSDFGHRSLHRQHVPPSWFLTTSTVYSASEL